MKDVILSKAKDLNLLGLNRGIYLLHLSLGKGQELSIGRLGRASFPKGFYVYAGSAQKNLRQRLERHLRNAKSRGTLSASGGCPTNKTPGGATAHWHIDYLLPHAKILSIQVFKASKEWECRLGRRLSGLEGARIIMKGFGASDCRCPSHLYYFSLRPHLNSISVRDKLARYRLSCHSEGAKRPKNLVKVQILRFAQNDTGRAG